MPSKSKKKGRKPAHQNSFAFRHNPKSKLTEKILASPNVGLCRRCREKIEWRKQYRKYKPLTQPAKCNICQNRNVMTAYHTICGGCAVGEKALATVRAALGESVAVEGESDLGAEFGSQLLGRTSAEKSDTPQLNKMMKACSMCVKEWALPEKDDDNPIETEIQKLKEEMEKKLGRPLKLREGKALERKVETSHAREKQRLKEERRKVRWGNDEAVESSSAGQDNDTQKDLCREVRKFNLSKEDEEDDDFLTAVGGKGQLLTGQAYQEMLLRKDSPIST